MHCEILKSFKKTSYSSLISTDLDFQSCQKAKILSYKGTNMHPLTRTALLFEYPLQVSLKGMFQQFL